MKNVNYLNDPRMSGLKSEPFPVQEVHAWRLAEQDEKQRMTAAQREAHFEAMRNRTESFCAQHGICLNFAKTAVTV